MRSYYQKYLMVLVLVFIFPFFSFGGNGGCFGQRDPKVFENEEISTPHSLPLEFRFNQVFVVSELHEEPVRLALTELSKEPVGNRLLYEIKDKLNTFRIESKKKLIREQHVEEAIQEKWQDTSFKIHLLHGGKTGFSPPITHDKHDTDYSIMKFFPKIELSSLDPSSILVVSKEEDGDSFKQEQSLKMVLAHELVHAFHFLDNPMQYRMNNTRKGHNDFNAFFVSNWPDLQDTHDGIRAPENWDYKPEELITVIGSQFEEVNQEESKEDHFLVMGTQTQLIEQGKGFFELSMNAPSQKFARFTYNTENKTALRKETRKIVLDSTKKHKNAILKKQYK